MGVGDLRPWVQGGPAPGNLELLDLKAGGEACSTTLFTSFVASTSLSAPTSNPHVPHFFCNRCGGVRRPCKEPDPCLGLGPPPWLAPSCFQGGQAAGPLPLWSSGLGLDQRSCQSWFQW